MISYKYLLDVTITSVMIIKNNLENKIKNKLCSESHMHIMKPLMS